MNTELDDLFEQIEACKDIIHHYTCAICGMATATTPLILVRDLSEEGSRVTVVGMCDTCKEDDGG